MSIQQNNLIIINASNESAFVSFCYNGNLEMAKCYLKYLLNKIK